MKRRPPRLLEKTAHNFRNLSVRLTCAAYETEFGLELRSAYGDDLMRSRLFRGVDRNERRPEGADAWHLALLEKGFSEIPP